MRGLFRVRFRDRYGHGETNGAWPRDEAERRAQWGREREPGATYEVIPDTEPRTLPGRMELILGAGSGRQI